MTYLHPRAIVSQFPIRVEEEKIEKKTTQFKVAVITSLVPGADETTSESQARQMKAWAQPRTARAKREATGSALTVQAEAEPTRH